MWQFLFAGLDMSDSICQRKHKGILFHPPFSLCLYARTQRPGGPESERASSCELDEARARQLIHVFADRLFRQHEVAACIFELRREHALSTNATLLLYAVMQEELFDTTKSMTLEDAGRSPCRAGRF